VGKTADAAHHHGRCPRIPRPGGARRDFDRVRLDDVEAYLDEIKRTDPRFMASENLGLLDEIEKRVAMTGDDEPLALDIPMEEL
jgi:hypothetical protein